jgi:hypothetical protein
MIGIRLDVDHVVTFQDELTGPRLAAAPPIAVQ